MTHDTLTILRHITLAAALVAAIASPSRAQEPDPLPKIALDVQAATPKFPRDPSVASSLTVTTDNLPGRGLGAAVGVHVYPGRLGKVTLGIGAQFLVSSASRTLEPTTSGGADGPTVEARYSALSPQLSLNFGGPNGWSYVSGGIGWATFTIERTSAPVAEPDGRLRTLHYGGGARWFAKKHLAFSFDVRFHRYPAQNAVTGRPAYPKGRMLVASAGISVK